MAKRKTAMLPLAFFVAVVIQAATPAATAGATGFRLPLVHAGHGNLTGWELIRAQVKATESRMCYLASSSVSAGVAALRMRVEADWMEYKVVVRIGSEKLPFSLTMDTGSGITWIQCKPCHPKCNQLEPLFDPETSRSYVGSTPHDPLCEERLGFKRVGGRCTFEIRYLDGVEVSGVFARDDFTFGIDDDYSTIPGLAFGCAHSNRVETGSIGVPTAGILGLNRSPTSFILQLRARRHMSVESFSYCLFQYGAAQFGYLRFGHRGDHDMLWTRFVDGDRPYNYYLHLSGIRMDGHPGVTVTAEDGPTAIDSGSTYSVLTPRLFDITEQATVEHFRRNFHEERLQQDPHNLFGVCFRKPMISGLEPSRHYPSMSFDFAEGASLRVGGEDLFVTIEVPGRRDIVCLAVMRSQFGKNIIGAMQQHNHRFKYDLDRGVLLFAPEDCSKDWERS